MDDELKQLLEAMRQEIANTRQDRLESRRHTDEKFEESRRHFEVVAERLESKIELVAEGVTHCNQRIDRLDAKVDRFAADVAQEFNETRAMIKFSHHDLDRRLRTLEDVVADLQSRVERLESTTH